MAMEFDSDEYDVVIGMDVICNGDFAITNQDDKTTFSFRIPSEVEIDFAVQTEKRVIPMEAKAEENVKSKSLRTYIDENPNLKGLRVSMKNYIDQGWMENLPLYAIEGYLRPALTSF